MATLTLPDPTDKAAWKLHFIAYYTTNCPSKVDVINEGFMNKWEGKYEKLWKGVSKKYGPPGQPIVPPPAKPKPRGGFRRRGGGPPGASRGRGAKGPKKSIADCHDEFVALIAQHTPSTHKELAPRPQISIVDAKQSSASSNGLETSTFTVCCRMRPVLPEEENLPGDGFRVTFPGKWCDGVTGSKDTENELHHETAMLLKPSIKFDGTPTLTETPFMLDYVFSEESEQEIYDTVGSPLVARALEGRTGVIFAYGQTGSGKTHTMNHLMDRVAVSLLMANKDTTDTTDTTAKKKTVQFSYLEILGNDLTDTLVPENVVKMGETEDGSVELRNLSKHTIDSSEALLSLIATAKAKRSVAATESNDASSRSHGIAMFTVGAESSGENSATVGKLYVIDLAGSESTKDVKKHDRARMNETKKINVSLNALKECIQARTLASTPGSAHNTHVPYRRSRLTLLLKDIFDVRCPRMTATVVLATTNPLAKDSGQTNTTLGYAAPLREAVGMFGMNRKKRGGSSKEGKESKSSTTTSIAIEVDVNDPVLWSNQQLLQYLTNELQLSEEDIGDVKSLTGLQLCAMPAPQVFAKMHGNELLANKVINAMWELIVAAKLVKRRKDGSILTDEAEAAEMAAKKAKDDARMDAQRAKAAAAIQAARQKADADDAAAAKKQEE